MGKKILCCHAMTAGAAVGMLQLCMAALLLSASAIALHRWRTWQALEPSKWHRRPTDAPAIVANATATNVSTAAPQTFPSHWYAAWLEFELAQAVGFCSVWIATLVIYALTFRYYLAIMVLPNLFILIMAIFMIIVLLVACVLRLFAVDSGYQTDDYEEAMLVYIAAFLLVWLLLLFVFIALVFMFYKHMKTVGRKDRVIVEGPTFD